MRNSERKPKASVSAIWTEAVMDEEPVRVSIVNGVARVRIWEFDIHVPGNFDGDVDEVVAAYKRQEEEMEEKIANFNANPEPPPLEPPEGWVPFSDQDIQDFVVIPCDVIPLNRGDRND